MIPEEATKAALEAVLNETYGASYSRDLVRIALEAAAPYLRAQALEDAADEIASGDFTFPTVFPVNTGLSDLVTWGEVHDYLRARAVTERGGE
ncbi:hypothetical protein AB4Z38_06990 [Arthrobacter sp. 2RAF6]|uniref:hypothetical protein n=1 Tax=Arthrobacter sp. 2RAF6 TaxID=3233002 RepID=UPI003F8F89CF